MLGGESESVLALGFQKMRTVELIYIHAVTETANWNTVPNDYSLRQLPGGIFQIQYIPKIKI